MPEVLSDADVSRIEREELLRKDIRAAITTEVARPKQAREILWAGINSTFGIWFLTAVFVTGLGSIYSQWYERDRERQRKHETQAAEAAKKSEAEQAIELRRKETYERITLEISFRYSSALAGLRDAHELFQQLQSRRSHKAIVQALRPLTRPADANSPPLFQEYASYSGFALIAEMRRHSGQGEATMLKDILARTSAFLYDVTADRSYNRHSAKAVASALIDVMRNERWDNGFAYTDCRSDRPFC